MRPHYTAILSFIRERESKIGNDLRLGSHEELKDYIVMYWLLHLCNVAPLEKVVEYFGTIGGIEDESSIRNRLYCMLLAG